MNLNLTAAVAAATLGLLLAGPAQAGGGSDVWLVNATANCNGALPSFDTSLRKRPLAIANEADANAFISCSMPGYEFSAGNDRVFAYFRNRGAASATVNCQLIDGIQFYGSTAYPRSIELAPGEYAPIYWRADQYSLPAFSNWANLSCSLPGGVEIAEILFVSNSPL